MELDHAIKYWVQAKKTANNLATAIHQTYYRIMDTVESQCGQHLEIDWEYTHSIEKDNTEVHVRVNREGVNVAYVHDGWTVWSAFLPDESASHWTCTLPQLEKVYAVLMVAADIVENEVMNAAINALLTGQRSAAVTVAEGKES